MKLGVDGQEPDNREDDNARSEAVFSGRASVTGPAKSIVVCALRSHRGYSILRMCSASITIWLWSCLSSAREPQLRENSLPSE